MAGSLPFALGKLGVEVLILMPRYRGLRGELKKLSKNVSVGFIENEAFFNRSSLYGNDAGDYPDNLDRFSFFSDEALGFTKKQGFKPDIVHVNDWQTALIPVFLKTKWANDPFFQKTRTLLTIHNLAYQGVFPERQFTKLGLDSSLFSIDGFEFYGKVNLLKAGILFADAVNTVSPTYAREIQTDECGYSLDGVVRKRQDVLRGILNGIDTNFWDPAKDKFIKGHYSKENLKGKALCKKALQERCGLEADPAAPVFGMVTRLAQQKGLDILADAAHKFFSQKAQFVLLGDGDGAYERKFRTLGRKYSKSAAVYLGFNAVEAHGIYAGADFFLMPSLYEPCGLGQLISLRYGTIPVVRKTGGLADTIVDVKEDTERGNGFMFTHPTPEAFLGAVGRALKTFEDKKRFNLLRKHAMGCDFSWQHSAKEYKKFYTEVLKN